MCKILIFTACVLLTEIILTFVFQITARIYYKTIGFDFRSIFKGVFERMFLLIALLNQYPHAITFFGAIKVATRLKHADNDNETNRFNDYYLIGNLLSVAIGIGYSYLWVNFDIIRGIF